MIISLISIMEAEHASMDVNVPVDFHEVVRNGEVFPVKAEEPIRFQIIHVKGQEFHITASGYVEVTIPCDRCLEPVRVGIPIEIREIYGGGKALSDKISDKATDETSADDHDEMPYLEGYNLDAEQMIRSEIAIGWPVKTLCKETCLGICKSCGANRNLKPCRCEDFIPDPRMAAIQDIFKKLKEV